MEMFRFERLCESDADDSGFADAGARLSDFAICARRDLISRPAD
jgi:hypothetical protein